MFSRFIVVAFWAVLTVFCVGYGGCGPFNPIGHLDKQEHSNGDRLEISAEFYPSHDPWHPVSEQGPSAKLAQAPTYSVVISGKRPVERIGLASWRVFDGDTLTMYAQWLGGPRIYKGIELAGVSVSTASLDKDGKFTLVVSSESDISKRALVRFLDLHEPYRLFDAIFVTPAQGVSFALMSYNDGFGFFETGMKKFKATGKEWFGVLRTIPDISGGLHLIRVATREGSQAQTRNDAILSASLIDFGDPFETLTSLSLGDPMDNVRMFSVDGSNGFTPQGSEVLDRTRWRQVPAGLEGEGPLEPWVEGNFTPPPLALTSLDSIPSFDLFDVRYELPAGTWFVRDSDYYVILTRLNLPKWSHVQAGFTAMGRDSLFIPYKERVVSGDLTVAGTWAIVRFSKEELTKDGAWVPSLAYSIAGESGQKLPLRIMFIRGALPQGWTRDSRGAIVLDLNKARKV